MPHLAGRDFHAHTPPSTPSSARQANPPAKPPVGRRATHTTPWPQISHAATYATPRLSAFGPPGILLRWRTDQPSPTQPAGGIRLLSPCLTFLFAAAWRFFPILLSPSLLYLLCLPSPTLSTSLVLSLHFTPRLTSWSRGPRLSLFLYSTETVSVESVTTYAHSHRSERRATSRCSNLSSHPASRIFHRPPSLFQRLLHHN